LAVKVTMNVARVMRAIARDRRRQHWAYDLATQLCMPAMSVRHALRRMAEGGWLEEERERINEALNPHSPRVFYRITPQGLAAAGEITTLIGSSS
jgi:PadR family transcriptional regulator PadR